jgi:phospholipase C
MVVISPWARPGVDGTTYDFTSVLRFIGENFGLPRLNARTDKLASLRSAFQFGQPLPRWYAKPAACPDVRPVHLAKGTDVLE